MALPMPVRGSGRSVRVEESLLTTGCSICLPEVDGLKACGYSAEQLAFL